MRKVIRNIQGFASVEVLIVLAIILIISRYIFAPQLYDFETRMWRSVGVPPELVRSIIGSFFTYLIWRAISERKSKKRKRFQ